MSVDQGILCRAGTEGDVPAVAKRPWNGLAVGPDLSAHNRSGLQRCAENRRRGR